MKCPLCGYVYDKEEAGRGCGGCPVRNCDVTRCPDCGYESLPEPGLIKFLKRRFKNASE